MHILEKAFLNLLRGNISILEDPDIRIGNRFSPYDNTPCVTLDVVDENFIRRRFITLDNMKYLRKLYDVDLWINIYVNTEEDRQSIIEDIDKRILQAEANHYTTCTNFNDNICNKLESECEVLTTDNGRTIKNQCPNLKNYQSFFKTYHIQKNTFKLLGVTNLDELDISQPVLRTIFKLNMNYYSYYKIGGKSFNNLNLSGDLL